jgi:hypothetical protein
MNNRRNYYRVLHVDRDAPAAVIQASYRTLMHRLGIHPDLGGDAAEAALVNEAFATLSDPLKRAAYDTTLRRPSLSRSSEAASAAPAPPAATPVSIGLECSFCGTIRGGSRPPRPESTCVSCGSPLCPPPQPAAGETSRRTMERLTRELPVSFRRARTPEVVCEGSTKDISAQGMRLLTPVRLSTGERLLVESSFCIAVGTVKSTSRSVTAQRRVWEFGVEFLTLRLVHDQGGLISILA